MRLIGWGIAFIVLSTSGVLAQDAEISEETGESEADAAAATVEGGESSTDDTETETTDAEAGESSEDGSDDVAVNDDVEDESAGGGALQEGVDSGHGCQVAFGATTSPVPPALLGLYVVLAHIRRRRRRRFHRHANV